MEKVQRKQIMNNIKNYPGFQVLRDDVWVIKNWFSPEELDFWTGIANAATEEDWNKTDRDWWHDKFLYIGDMEDVKPKILELHDRIKGLLDPEFKDWMIGHTLSLHRMREGQEMFLHADDPVEQTGKTNYVKLSFVMYLNEFNGGELYYPRLDFTYHPEPGDIVIHPGHSQYEHKTLPVKPGPTRYVLATTAQSPEFQELAAGGYLYHDTEGNVLENEIDPVAKYFKKSE